MNKMLENKNILIMGVRNKWSIGWGIAKACHEQGANLIFSYQGDRERDGVLELTESLGKVSVYECNVASDESIENLFNEIKINHKELYAVVHSVAHANREDIDGRFVDTSREGFAHALDISAYSLVAVSKHASLIMPEGGSIITLSYLGSERVLPNYNVMGVAKAALEASVRYLASDLGRDGIRVNAISAGPIKTISSKAIRSIQTILDATIERAPLRRNVTTDDIGRSALYLLSDLASGVSGEVIHVDSGYSIMGI